MIHSDRFRAHKALSFDLWAEARQSGVTATEVARAATKSGFRDMVAEFETPPEPYDNPYMEFGRKAEGPISLWLKDEMGIFPNEWLIAHENMVHLATPDGLSLDHTVISEIKTTGKDFDGKIPIAYQRQVQWQLYVTGAEYCVFAWMLRVDSGGGYFQPGWIEPKTMIVYPSRDTIEDLIGVADRLWKIKRDVLGKNGGE